jgi:hypothetical protein
MPFCPSSICTKYDLCENHLGGSPWHHMNLSHGILRFDSLIHFTNCTMGFQDWDLRQICLVLGQIWIVPRGNLGLYFGETLFHLANPLQQFDVVPRHHLVLSLGKSLGKSQDNLELSWEWLFVVGLWATMGVDVVLGYHLVCPFKNLGMTWSCAGSHYLWLGCEPWWGLWVSRPSTWGSPQFTLNLRFILMNLHS